MNEIQKRLLSVECFIPLDAPEWKEFGMFTVRSLRGRERDIVLDLIESKEDDKFKNAKGVVLLLADDKGKRIFGDSQEEIESAHELPQMLTNRIIAQGIAMLGYKSAKDAEAEKKSSG